MHLWWLTLLLQLQQNALPSIHVEDTAVDIDSRTIVCPLAFLSQLDHTSGSVSISVRKEVVLAIGFIDGNVQVGQVELYGRLWVSWGHADTLDTFPHHGTLWLIQKDRRICLHTNTHIHTYIFVCFKINGFRQQTTHIQQWC